MVCLLLTLCAALGLAVLLLAWKILLMRRSAEEIRQGLALRLEEDTNTLLSISSQDRALRRLAADLNSQLRLLRQERRRCQRGDLALKDAVAGISHDLRTPLTAICGYLDLLEGEEKSQAVGRYLELIRDRTDHLRDLMEEFFQYSADLSTRSGPTLEAISLSRALEESLAAWYPVLSARGVAPKISLPQDPVVRRLDRAALGRVLGNLLSNALKYSAGDLAVSLDLDGTITFTNSAPGMTPVTAQKLFDRYFTVQTGSHATGLGLSIARQLTEEMGGVVEARCREEVLTVTVRFPL